MYVVKQGRTQRFVDHCNAWIEEPSIAGAYHFHQSPTCPMRIPENAASRLSANNLAGSFSHVEVRPTTREMESNPAVSESLDGVLGKGGPEQEMESNPAVFESLDGVLSEGGPELVSAKRGLGVSETDRSGRDCNHPSPMAKTSRAVATIALSPDTTTGEGSPPLAGTLQILVPSFESTATSWPLRTA